MNISSKSKQNSNKKMQQTKPMHWYWWMWAVQQVDSVYSFKFVIFVFRKNPSFLQMFCLLLFEKEKIRRAIHRYERKREKDSEKHIKPCEYEMKKEKKANKNLHKTKYMSIQTEMVLCSLVFFSYSLSLFLFFFWSQITETIWLYREITLKQKTKRNATEI